MLSLLRIIGERQQPGIEITGVVELERCLISLFQFVGNVILDLLLHPRRTELHPRIASDEDRSIRRGLADGALRGFDLDVGATHIAPFGGANAAAVRLNGNRPRGNDVAVQFDIRICRSRRRVNRDGGVGGIRLGVNFTAKLILLEIRLTETYPAARVGDLDILHDETALRRTLHVDDGRALCRQAARSADGIRLEVHIAARDGKIGQNESDGRTAWQNGIPRHEALRFHRCFQ